MKTIIYNYDNLKEEEINNYEFRAKMLIINSNGEILLAHSDSNYHFPGGHLNSGETYDECLVREIKEETGITIPLVKREPFMQIVYMNRDYPKKGMNSKHIANYYCMISDEKPVLDNTNLTSDEKKSNFELKYIHKDYVVKELKDSLKYSTRFGVTRDTIDVIEEFLNSSKGYYFYNK